MPDKPEPPNPLDTLEKTLKNPRSNPFLLWWKEKPMVFKSPKQSSRISTVLRSSLRAAGYVLSSFGMFSLCIALFALWHINSSAVRHIHFVNFLRRWWQSFTSAVGSNSQGFALSVLEPVGIFVVSVLALFVVAGREAVTREKAKTLIAAFAITFTVTVLLYGPTFIRKGVDTAYSDHQSLVEAKKVATKDRDDLLQERDSLKTENQDLKSKLASKPSVVTKEVPEQVKKHCWVHAHYGPASSKIEGAVTATLVAIHCNYKIDAPFRVMIEFDSDFIGMADVDMSGANLLSVNDGRHGNVYTLDIMNSPLSPEGMFMVTVYGKTSRHPKPIGADIRSINGDTSDPK